MRFSPSRSAFIFSVSGIKASNQLAGYGCAGYTVSIRWVTSIMRGKCYRHREFFGSTDAI